MKTFIKLYFDLMAMAFPADALVFVYGLLNNLVVAAIILLIGFIAGRLLGRFVTRFLSEIGLNKMIGESSNISIPADEIIGSVVMFLVYFFAIVIAMDTLALGNVLFNIISVFIMVIVVASIILSLIDFVPNVFSGVFLHQKNVVQKGDVIKAGGFEGRIVSIDLVDTKLETKAGDLVYVPNSLLAKNIILVKKRKS